MAMAGKAFKLAVPLLVDALGCTKSEAIQRCPPTSSRPSRKTSLDDEESRRHDEVEKILFLNPRD